MPELVAIGCLVYAIVCAALCSGLVEQKGLDKAGPKIMAGLLLGIVGLIYVAGLPDMILRRSLQSRMDMVSGENKKFENLPPLD